MLTFIYIIIHSGRSLEGRVDLLTLVCDVKLRFCHFPMWYLGSGVVLDCIIPDLCRISYFKSTTTSVNYVEVDAKV